MGNTDSPLVSVIVITYNSSKYILETLESIKDQTYNNIELIISDDCSKDNTISICQKWLAENQHFFIRTQLLTVDSNTGTVANVNRGIRKSQGSWIKTIAGDDYLLPNCLIDDIAFIRENKLCDILITDHIRIDENGEQYDFPQNRLEKHLNELSTRFIRWTLFKQNFIAAPTALIKRKTYDDLKGYNEKFFLIEDWPFWQTAAYYNKRFMFLDKVTVAYRKSKTSISQNDWSPTFRKIDSEIRNQGKSYLKKLYPLLNFYLWSMNAVRLNPSSIFYKLIHSLNIFNIEYYRYNRYLDSFNKMS